MFLQRMGSSAFSRTRCQVRRHSGSGSLFLIVVTGLERDLEMERRKSASLQDTLKEHEKEYQKLKVGLSLCRAERTDSLPRTTMTSSNGVAYSHRVQSARPQKTYKKIALKLLLDRILPSLVALPVSILSWDKLVYIE